MKSLALSRITAKMFMREMAHHPKAVVLMILSGPVRMLRTVFAGLVVSFIYGDLSSGRSINWSLIVLYLVLFFGSVAYDYINNIHNSRMLTDVIKRLHEKCFSWLTNQDNQFYSDNFSGSLVAKSNRFVKAFEAFGFTLNAEIIPLTFTILGSLIIMTYYNWQVGLAISVVWLFSVIVISKLTLKRIPLRRQAVQADSAQTGKLADAVTNAQTIKTFSREDHELQRYKEATQFTHSKYRTSWKRANRNDAVIVALAGVLQSIIIVGGAIMVDAGKMKLQVFLLFQVYIIRIIESLFKSGFIVRTFEGIFGDSEEMIEILQSSPTVNDNIVTKPLIVKKANIEFKNVNFSYDSKNKPLFDGLTLHIEPGQKVGLVGPSGGGKTSITKLLLRFFDLDSGSISIDGTDISDVTQADLRRSISYVSQEPILFHRSLIENIRYGRLDASDTEIEQVAKLANAHEFIQDLPDGYDTLVGERGVKLSGGQRQRIAIARAMLKQAPIIVLDEATSALDSESEVLIQEALWRLMKGKTALVIAHRLSTIQKLDRIVVLDKGNVVEDGSHNDLLQKIDGLYARLWTHQSGGFLQD